jgi:hypothetical protein
MCIESTATPQHICVETEHDVTTMRQEARRIARTLGLGLGEQAKIATALSTVARVLLARHRSARFTFQTTVQGTPAALEIACVLGPATAAFDQLEEIFNLADVRLLVDEATLSCDTGEAVLSLRMHLRYRERGSA